MRGSDIAYIGDFIDGLLIDDDGTGPKPIAAQEGTTIQVKDMFYNNLQRKKSIGLNEEYAKIVEVVTRYAIHYPMIKFSCRKMDDKKTDISTHNIPRPVGDELINDPGEKHQRQMNSLRVDIIKKTYGQNSAGKDFLDFSEYLDYFRYDLSCIYSKPNTVQGKKNYLLLFINNRLVESDKIKRAIDAAYQSYQPKGGYSYFFYMQIDIPTEQIDVNVHPTKKQVIFERQDEFCEFLKEMFEGKLKSSANERGF